MKHYISRSIFIQAVLLIALIILLLFFFRVNTLQSVKHSESVSTLLSVDRFDAELDLAALQVLTATMQQYDSLVKLHHTFDELESRMLGDEGEEFTAVSADVTSKTHVLLSQLRVKLELIERLKTQSAIVRNGLLYLPTLIQELEQHPLNYVVHPHDFLIWLMSYSYWESVSSIDNLRTHMALIQRWINNHPDDLLIKNFAKHLQYSQKGQQSLSEIKKQYLSIPSKDALEALRLSYLNHHELKMRKINTLSLQLLFVCTALVIFLIFILRRLDKARVEAEQASNLLHDAVERLSEGFALYDDTGRLRLTNQRWLKLYGITDLIEYPDTLAELKQRRSEFIEEEYQHQDEVTGQTYTLQKTVKGRWLQASDAHMSEGGLVCIRVDVTDYKSVEHRLRQLGSAVEQSPVSIVITDLEGTIEYVNPKFEQVTGYRSAEAVGKNPRILKSGYSSDSEYRTMWCDLVAGKEWHGIFNNIKKDGSTYWESASISPIKDSHNQVTHFVAVKEDITQRKQASDDLKKAAAVFDATQEGILTADADLKITAVNPAFTVITGYTEDEVLGHAPTVLCSGKQDEHFYTQMWEEVKAQGSWASEVWNQRKNGSIYPQWLSITAVYDEEGEVSQYITVLSDMSERKAQEEKIHYQAYYDTLTSLPNRTLLMDRIEHDIANAKRSGHLSSLLFIDIDRFKRVNDTMGHEAGDSLLIAVADRLRALVRESDTVSRFGGDEFVILLANIPDDHHAAIVAEKVIAALSEPFNLNGYEVFSGASIGITMVPIDSSVPIELLRLADLAMYKAKESGRNQYHFFARNMQEKVNRRVVLEHMLRKGMEEGELEVFYQPIIDAQTHDLHGVEALLRWFQPEEGSIPPTEFIPVAEESGLIGPLGEFVLLKACQDIKELDSQGYHLDLSVNVSSRQYHLGFEAGKLARIIEQAGLSGTRLTLELTESLLFDGDDDILPWLEAFNLLGVKLSIDDFGTGYSSLSYLKRFPINTLKIDRAFVADLDRNDDAASLVTAIISMANSLKMDVVAEGVETSGQLAMISGLGCKFIQGYFYAKPMPKEDLLLWIKHHDKRKSRITPPQDYTI